MICSFAAPLARFLTVLAGLLSLLCRPKHFEEFRLLERNGVPIDPNSIEYSRKDVMRIMPGEEVKVFFTFRDFLGRYPMHCHNVVQEDHSMMIRWDIVP